MSHRVIGAICTLGGICVISGCAPYRIEYHQRPQFYYMASEEKLSEEWTAPDGTIVKFSSEPLPSEQETLAAQAKDATREVDVDGDGKPDAVEPTPTWEERDDGSVKMRAFLPEHVIGNFLATLRDERYGEFYDQMLASSARDAFNASSNGQGKREFAMWCTKHRRSLMETLNRMGFGYLSADVVLRRSGSNTFRIGFSPRVSEQFKFKSVDVVYENGGCRLLHVK